MFENEHQAYENEQYTKANKNHNHLFLSILKHLAQLLINHKHKSKTINKKQFKIHSHENKQQHHYRNRSKLYAPNWYNFSQCHLRT